MIGGARRVDAERLEQLDHLVAIAGDQRPARTSSEFLLQALRRSGVSFAGSIDTEIRRTSLPATSFSSLAKVAPMGGQMVAQVVNTKLTATTRSFTRSV